MKFRRWFSFACLPFTVAFVVGESSGAQSVATGATVPMTHAQTLAGVDLKLPEDAPGSVTVLIVGFGRKSSDATTAWEKPVRARLAQAGAPRSASASTPHSVGFLDMAMLAEVPGWARPMVIRMIRSKVPETLRPNFVMLTEEEDAWKRVASYDAEEPEAAYVMVVDRGGRVHWTTHQPFDEAHWAELAAAVERVRNGVR